MSLKKRKEILEKNIAMEEDMIKNNKSYTGPNGKTYGPDHYKKAIEYDKKELDSVNSQLLNREKKKKQLADAMSKAGIGKGIAGAISKETGDKVRKVASDLGKGIAEGIKNTVPNARTGLGREVAKGIAKSASGLGATAISQGMAEAASEARTGGLASKVQGLKDAEEKALKRRKK